MFFKMILTFCCSLFLFSCSQVATNKVAPQETNVENNANSLNVEETNEHLWYRNYIVDRMQSAIQAIEEVLNQSNNNHDNEYIQSVNESLSELHSIANDLQHETNIPSEYVEFHNAFLQSINSSIETTEQLLRNETTNIVPLKENYDILLTLVYQYDI